MQPSSKRLGKLAENASEQTSGATRGAKMFSTKLRPIGGEITAQQIEKPANTQDHHASTATKGSAIWTVQRATSVKMAAQLPPRM